MSNRERTTTMVTIALIMIFAVFPFGAYLSDRIFGYCLGSALLFAGMSIRMLARELKYNSLQYISCIWVAGAVSNVVDELLGFAHITFAGQEMLTFISITLISLNLERRIAQQNK